MSGDRTSPRFEVVASTRRQFTIAQKRAIVAEIEAGATVTEVARRHNVHTSLLFRWRREYAGTAPPSKPVAPPAFLPVSIATPPASPPPARSIASKMSMIEIELAFGRKLRVASDIDVAELRRIIVALETA